MRTKLKISVISFALIGIFLVSVISTINFESIDKKNQTNNKELLTEFKSEPKTSDDTFAPIISDVQVSDENLELLDAQTIICNVTDDSVINFVYIIIWFNGDPITREMLYVEGKTYQAIWSSNDAELGNYDVDIRAQDEHGNADTIENAVSFTIIPKPDINVASLNSNHAQITGDENSLKYDNSDQLIVEGNQYLDNGDNALYCTPNPPWYTSTMYGVNGASALRYCGAPADDRWSKSFDRNEIALRNDEWNVGRPVYVELRPKFYVRNDQCPNEDPTDIEISIALRDMSYRCLPSFSITIYNYHRDQWVTLYSVADPYNPWPGTWLHQAQFSFNKNHLLPHDNDLSHFISEDGYSQVRIVAGSSHWLDFYTWIWIPFIGFIPIFFPHAYVDLVVDQCNVKATYNPPSTVDFNFEPEVLNGEDDYYLYFKGETVGGDAQINVNGEKAFDIAVGGTTIGDTITVPIYDANDISITGKFDNVNIDYFYLEKIRDRPYYEVESISGIDSPLDDKLKYDDGFSFSNLHEEKGINIADFDTEYYGVTYSESGDPFAGMAVDDNILFEQNGDQNFDVSEAWMNQYFTFELGQNWKDNYYLENCVFNFGVWWSNGYSSSYTDDYCKLEILKNDGNWELLEENPMIPGECVSQGILNWRWNEGSLTLENGGNLNDFNDKYISSNGQITFRMHEDQTAYLEEYIFLKWDYISLDITYYNIEQELEFIFADDLLNGENDFNLWFQGETGFGEAKFYVDGVQQFIIGPTECTVGPVLELNLNNPSSIKIVLIDAEYIYIDYLYLERI